jgi:ABC-2 type transport system permease protein
MAVFDSSPHDVLNGMTWSQTVAYISIAMLLGNTLYSFVDYQISGTVRSGDLIIFLMRPLDFQLYFFLTAVGQILLNILLIGVPGILFITLILRLDFSFGTSAVFFIPSMLLGIGIAFLLDYLVGIIAFYTESIFGITNAKGMLLMFFSGQLVPLAFFPAALRQVAMVLPFQAVINTPVSLLTDASLDIVSGLNMLLVQFIWVLVLIIISRLFFNRAVRKVTVNGG